MLTDGSGCVIWPLQVEAFLKRALAKRYVCIYIDATYIAVKRETVPKEAVYIAVDIREDGSKEVLTYSIAPTESAYIWNELLMDVKERGVEEILLFIPDGEQLSHEEGLDKFLVSQFDSYNQRFARCHIGFDRARAELQAMFSTRD